MTGRDKLMAVAVVIVSVPIVLKVSSCGAFIMAAILFIVLYVAWAEIDRR